MAGGADLPGGDSAPAAASEEETETKSGDA
jgi:hypothetical protein